MSFGRSFPTRHSHDGINTLRRRRRVAAQRNPLARALVHFGYAVNGAFIRLMGRSRRDEDGIDWGSEAVREFMRPDEEEGGVRCRRAE